MGQAVTSTVERFAEATSAAQNATSNIRAYLTVMLITSNRDAVTLQNQAQSAMGIFQAQTKHQLQQVNAQGNTFIVCRKTAIFYD